MQRESNSAPTLTSEEAKSPSPQKFIHSLESLAEVTILQSLKGNDANIWHQFYLAHQYDAWDKIYLRMCSSDYFACELSSALALKIWQKLIQQYAPVNMPLVRTLKRLTALSILNGPHKAEFWKIITEADSSFHSSKVGKLLQQIAPQKSKDLPFSTFVHQFSLAIWKQNFHHLNRLLIKLKLEKVTSTWFLQQRAELFIAQLAVVYLNERQWHDVSPAIYFSAIRLAIMANHVSWLEEQKKSNRKIWQQAFGLTTLDDAFNHQLAANKQETIAVSENSPERIKKWQIILSDDLLTDNMTSWIFIFDAMPKRVQIELMQKFGTQILQTAIKNNQPEILRYFWAQWPSNLPYPNLSKEFAHFLRRGSFENSYTAITDGGVNNVMIGILYHHLSQDDFFTALPDHCAWQRPERFLFLWQLLPPTTQHEWLEKTQGKILLDAVSEGLFEIVQTIWSGHKQYCLDVLLRDNYKSFKTLGSNPTGDKLATKRFLMEQIPELKEVTSSTITATYHSTNPLPMDLRNIWMSGATLP